jgi:hypothetical protein
LHFWVNNDAAKGDGRFEGCTRRTNSAAAGQY